MLSTYQEIRDRVYELCRKHELRPDWAADTKFGRVLFLYDVTQVIVARTFVPTQFIDQIKLAKLERDLAHLFGEGWLS
ncbi:hypothetical protein [Nonomuraea cavernae]|uniref:hypothetical protein n=1 Tax=Nonomuraea cavernae TaxID=2045107 RepID=UPI00340BE15C